MNPKNETSAKEFAAKRNQLMDRIMRDSPLTASDRLVGLLIARHLSTDKGFAWPSMTYIAKALDVNPRTVGRAIKKLRGRHFRVVPKRGKSNRYYPLENTRDTDVRGLPCPKTKLPEWYDADVLSDQTQMSDKDKKYYQNKDVPRLIADWTIKADASALLLKAASGQLSKTRTDALIHQFTADTATISGLRPTSPSLHEVFNQFRDHVLVTSPETASTGDSPPLPG